MMLHVGQRPTDSLPTIRKGALLGSLLGCFSGLVSIFQKFREEVMVEIACRTELIRTVKCTK